MKVLFVKMSQINFKKAPFLNEEIRISFRTDIEFKNKISLAKKFNLAPASTYYITYENGNGIKTDEFQISKCSEEMYNEEYLIELNNILEFLKRKLEFLTKEYKEQKLPFVKQEVETTKNEILKYEALIFFYH